MLKGKKGSVVVIIAIVMPVLLLLLALVADIGMLYVVRSQLQTVADAASLAGVAFENHEVYICEPEEPDALRFENGDVSHIKMYVQLHPIWAKERAKNIAEANLVSILPLVSVNLNEIRYKPAVPDGRVYYWGELVMSQGGEYEIGKVEYDYMEPEGANSYVVEFEAEMSTILLGSLTSFFSNNGQMHTLVIPVSSKSSFDCVNVFADKLVLEATVN